MVSRTFSLQYVWEGVSHHCIGKLEVVRFNPPNFYASWEVSYVGGEHIAGKSRSYFVGDQLPDDNIVVDMIKDDIKKFKIGRQHPFKSVEW